MTKGEWTNLKVRVVFKEAFALSYQSKADKITKAYGKSNPNLYINEYLLPRVAFEELDGDRFELTELSDKAFVRDRYLRRDFDVSLIGGKLWCESDQSEGCVHVLYVREHPRVKKILKDKGL